MISEATTVTGVLRLSWPVHRDERGFFSRTFDAADLNEAGLNADRFVQVSQSRSVQGALRALHTRKPPGEAKLVRCVNGAIYDVVVDLRPGSETYLKWEAFELRGDSGASLYLPAGLLHGWQALTATADVMYWIDETHDPSADVTVAFDDPDLAIPWPLPVSRISDRDRKAPSLQDVLETSRNWRF